MFIPKFVIPETITNIFFSVPVTAGSAGGYYAPNLNNYYYYFFHISGIYSGNISLFNVRQDLVYQVRLNNIELNTSARLVINGGSVTNVTCSIFGRCDSTQYKINQILHSLNIWGPANSAIMGPSFTYTGTDTSASIIFNVCYGLIKRNYVLSNKKRFSYI